MGECYLVKNGGLSLNFKVVGGTVEPANPKENTIWVNTDVPVNGWVFRADPPSSPVEGMVWIATGMSSAGQFNALKKNGIILYPLAASQYVGGAWVSLVAQSYQGGAWNAWIVRVSYSQAAGVASSQSTTGSKFTFATTYGGTYGGLSSIEKYPLMPFETVRLKGTVQLSKSISGTNFWMRVQMATSNDRTVSSGAIASASLEMNAGSTGLQSFDLSLDVSAETEARYVKMWVVTNTGTTGATVTVNITDWEVT